MIIDGYGDRKRIDAMNDTWGHLAPVPGKQYSGYILFYYGAYGDTTVINDDFPDLPSSPWYYDDMYDYVNSFTSINMNGL